MIDGLILGMLIGLFIGYHSYNFIKKVKFYYNIFKKDNPKGGK